MNTAFDEVDESAAILEDYRATVSELRGNLQRLTELVEEQILLETPPCNRNSGKSHSDHSYHLLQTD